MQCPHCGYYIKHGFDGWFQCRMVGELSKRFPELTGKQIAKQYKYSQGYVAKLLFIYRNLNRQILMKWQIAVTKLSVLEMYKVARFPKSEQTAKYIELLDIRIAEGKPRGRPKVK